MTCFQTRYQIPGFLLIVEPGKKQIRLKSNHLFLEKPLTTQTGKKTRDNIKEVT